MISVNLNDNSVSSIAKQLYLGLVIDGKTTMVFPNVAGTERLIAIRFDLNFEDDIEVSGNGDKRQTIIIEAQAVAFVNSFYDAETMPYVPVLCDGKIRKGIIGLLSSLHHLGANNEAVNEIRLILVEVLRCFLVIHRNTLDIPQLMNDMYQDYPVYEIDEDEMVSQETCREPYDDIYMK